MLKLFKYYDINLIMNLIIGGVIFYKNDSLCGSKFFKMTYPMNYEKNKKQNPTVTYSNKQN